MENFVVLQRGQLSPDIDPQKWFDTVLTSFWRDDKSQHGVFGDVTIRSDAPDGIRLKSICIEFTTELRTKPIRAFVHALMAKDANCQIHDHNYDSGQVPGIVKVDLVVEFMGTYIGETKWSREFNHAKIV